MIRILRNDEIKKALNEHGHQYLAGKLSKKQVLGELKDENINVGIGTHRIYEAEEAHYHSVCTEYQYVLRGKAKYFDITNMKEYEVNEGDFFIIENNTAYTLKAKKGCSILFFKYPAIDDKKEVNLTEEKERQIRKWQTSWEEKIGDPGEQVPKRGLIKEDNEAVLFYKTKENQKREEYNKKNPNNKKPLIKTIKERRKIDRKVIVDICKQSSSDVIKVLSVVLAIAGFVDCFSDAQKLLGFRFLFILLLGALALFLLLTGRYIYKYIQRIVSRSINNMQCIIYEDDYIANLIRIVSEDNNNSSANIFAMGMNESILYDHVDENGKRIEYTSITEDFYNFMKDYFDIDINVEIDKVIPKNKAGNNRPLKYGDTFTVDFHIAKSKHTELNSLVGKSFTVIFYINSYNENNDPNREKVQDARETTCRLVDKASDVIYHTKLGRNVSTVLMLPAIGTGKTGKGPYKHILFETINNLAQPNYCMPDYLVLSLRDYELFGDNYATERVLILTKKLFS